MTEDIQLEPPKRRRLTDKSTQEARRAVGAVINDFAVWRRQLAQMSVMASRRPSDEERAMMMTRCGSVRRLLSTARAAFEVQVGRLPPRAATNSRIADARIAMDNIDETIDRIVDVLVAGPSVN